MIIGNFYSLIFLFSVKYVIFAPDDEGGAHIAVQVSGQGYVHGRGGPPGPSSPVE